MPSISFNVKFSHQGEIAHRIELEDDVSVQTAKEAAAMLADVPAGNQRWIYKGKILDSNSILKNANITPGDTVLVFKSGTVATPVAVGGNSQASQVGQVGPFESTAAPSNSTSSAGTSSTAPNTYSTPNNAPSSVSTNPNPNSNLPIPVSAQPSYNYAQGFDLGMNKLLANSDLETCKSASSTLIKVVVNIINNPNEEKFRSIKKSNAVFAKKVTGIPGGVETLLGLGFTSTADEYVLYPSADAWNTLVSCRLKLENFVKKLETVDSSSISDSSSTSSSSIAGGGGGAAPSVEPSLDATQLIFQHLLRMSTQQTGTAATATSSPFPSTYTANSSSVAGTSRGPGFNWAGLLGETLQGKSGSISTNEALRGKTVGIYFSAHWCPPCRSFTPTFARYYEQKKRAGEQFEVVFVSSDKDNASFNSYFAEMPWLAVPFASRDLKNSLSSIYNVRGIPMLIILNPDGSMNTTDGRAKVMGGS